MTFGPLVAMRFCLERCLKVTDIYMRVILRSVAPVCHVEYPNEGSECTIAFLIRCTIEPWKRRIPLVQL